MDLIRVFVGTEDNQFAPQQVLEDSIRARTTGPVEVRFCRQEIERVGGTNFGFVRFMVPSLCEFKGKAIYLDADMVALADVRELWNALSDDYAIAVVTQPEGFFGGKDVTQMPQTSVMVLNCEKLTTWDPKTMFLSVVPNKSKLAEGQIHYRDFMALTWCDPTLLQSLDPRWNHFNVVRPDTKLVHFSHVRSQPWKNPSHPLTTVWARYLRTAIRRRALRRRDLWREIRKGHVDRQFLRYAVLP